MAEIDNIHVERHSVRDDMPKPRLHIVLRAIFGIFMVILYVGMGILLLINYFGWEGGWSWTRYVVGIVLIIYGFYRAYRQIKGID